MALSAEPSSVPKNQYRISIINIIIIPPSITPAIALLIPVVSVSHENMVFVFKSGTLLFPITLRFIDQREICVKIPASIAGISNIVCNAPVIKPAIIPAIVEKTSANKGFILKLTIITAHTQPPKAKLPSAVKSGISSNL